MFSEHVAYLCLFLCLMIQFAKTLIERSFPFFDFLVFLDLTLTLPLNFPMLQCALCTGKLLIDYLTITWFT